MIALKNSWTAKAAFVAFLQMAGVKARHLRSRNAMRSMRCAVQNKGITLSAYISITNSVIPIFLLLETD